MSKHEKTLRRTRRKTDATRRQRARTRAFRIPKSAIRNGAAVLAAAAAIAAGTSAYAEVVRFDNPAGPGHFDWFGPPISNRFLDLTLPAVSQTGADHDLPSEFWHAVETTSSFVRGSLTALTAVQTTGFYDLFAAPFSAGQLIPDAGLYWRSGGGYSYYPGYGSELPEGVPTYLSVRFDPGDGNHYGWFGVVRTGFELDAFAWGYETEPGVPIPAGAGGGGGCEDNADCTDEDMCTEDICDTDTGECSNDAVDCNDDDACTVDSCDAETGDCVNDAIVCEEGQKCVEGKCVCDTNCPADFDHDGDVDAADLAFLLGNWGDCD